MTSAPIAMPSRPPRTSGKDVISPRGAMASRFPATASSDLYDHRQDHRPAAQALVDERRNVVVQVLLNQVQLAGAGAGGVLERVLDHVAQVIDEPVALLEERDSTEDHLWIGDRRSVVGGD